MFLLVAELPRTYFILSVVLCSILCWVSLFLWLSPSALHFYQPTFWDSPCCSDDALNLLLRLLQTTSTKFSECRTGQSHINHIPAAEWKMMSFWVRWKIVYILGNSFGPFSLSPSMCREQRIKGAVFCLLEKKGISAFLRCFWFSG